MIQSGLFLFWQKLIWQKKLIFSSAKKIFPLPFFHLFLSFWTLDLGCIKIAFFSHLKIFCHINFRQSRKIPCDLVFQRNFFLMIEYMSYFYVLEKPSLYAFLSMRWLPQNNGMKLFLSKPSFPQCSQNVSNLVEKTRYKTPP